MKLMEVNTRVVHSGHGAGTIVRYNGTPSRSYAAENLGSAVVASAVSAGLGAAVVSSLYGGDRYPYVVKFDSGYQDVYGPGEVEPLEGSA